MSKEITKELYDKAACWMADKDDPCLLEESLGPKINVDQYFLKEAYDIMFRIYEIYNEAP